MDPQTFGLNKLICARRFSLADPLLEAQRTPHNLTALPALALQVDRAERQSELQTDKMMRAAAKDVHRLRGQSCKEPPEVQSFR